MTKNPWFTLILGLIVGLAFGYVLAERQAVPPARAMAASGAQGDALPQGHPPVAASGTEIASSQRAREQAAEIEEMLVQNPGDTRLMVALGNLYYDASQWSLARTWYEKAIAGGGSDPDVETDLAVVYRNLGEAELALDALERVVDSVPDHWQALYNKVVVLHFDLHRHDEAAAALAKLKELAASDSSVPDLSGLEAEVLGH
jgi:tetratricopeptide (TPR) repeat protein